MQNQNIHLSLELKYRKEYLDEYRFYSVPC